ncbi:hypothetical protein KIW84_076270 [Lathyrus oleraceus]|uniref:Uncharacterized protein n=1 Tax=Pisum sativum TaxID=3888 RepID=A0A9D5A0W1_PEA|nr:hypothetical protein KIW84_076270 [Pisum sativum]
MGGEPKAREIEASICFGKKENHELLERVKTSWRKIHKKGKVFFGPRENVALHPYVGWIKKRVEALKLPFEREEPFYKQLSQLDSDEPVTIPIKNYQQLQVENYKTQAKKDEMGMQLYQVNQEIRQLMHKLKKRNLKLEASKAKSKGKHKKELKILEKKLQDEQREAGRVRGEKKRLEFNLKERQKYLDKALEEKKKLEKETKIRKGDPIEDCDRCNQLCR